MGLVMHFMTDKIKRFVLEIILFFWGLTRNRKCVPWYLFVWRALFTLHIPFILLHFIINTILKQLLFSFQ